MSEPENFLERWSRRKREATDDQTAEPPTTNAESKTAPAPPADAEKPFDVSSLPSLNSITGGTDISGFLQAGVPDELRHAALRRAWSTDPQIRDFVGLVENGWDFNDPNAMHGFGPIEPSEVARLMGNFAMTPPPAEPAEVIEKDQLSRTESPSGSVTEGDKSAPVEPPTPSAAAAGDIAAPQNDADVAAAPPDASPDHSAT